MYRWPWPAAGELAMDDGCSSWLPAFQQGGDAARYERASGTKLLLANHFVQFDHSAYLFLLTDCQVKAGVVLANYSLFR
jgi:hypothetical protein